MHGVLEYIPSLIYSHHSAEQKKTNDKNMGIMRVPAYHIVVQRLNEHSQMHVQVDAFSEGF